MNSFVKIVHNVVHSNGYVDALYYENNYRKYNRLYKEKPSIGKMTKLEFNNPA